MYTPLAPATPDDLAWDRNHTAERLERLARLVRGATTATEAQLDAVYEAVVTLSQTIRPLLVHD